MHTLSLPPLAHEDSKIDNNIIGNKSTFKNIAKQYRQKESQLPPYLIPKQQQLIAQHHNMNQENLWRHIMTQLINLYIDPITRDIILKLIHNSLYMGVIGRNHQINTKKMHKYKAHAIYNENCICHEPILMPYVNQPFTPQSNYEHELFKCFMIQPLWDTTNALLTHLELPLRATSVHDLYSLIIDFQPDNIQHILNTNLILLTIKSAYQVYREKTDIISKNNNIDRRELNKLLFKARRKIYMAALSHEIHSLPIHHHQIWIYEKTHAKADRLLERDKLLIPTPQIEFELNPTLKKLYEDTWLKSDFFELKHNRITMHIPSWPS